ncbi:MAG: hypothetical protein QG566_309 [Patescibacteria group bacterium]|nr:hypothetical protein [Patescibacteria group bacterium]
MKKIVYLIAITFLLSIGGTVFAANPFNTDPDDCKTIAIGNDSTKVGVPATSGYGYCGWTLQNVQAKEGESVVVAIYYHNNSTSSAENTRITLNPSTTGASTNFNFSTTISSNLGSTSGTASLNLSSAQTLTLSSVDWYVNQNMEDSVALLGGQSDSSLINGGLNIGTIGSGWGTQGYVVATFRVGNNGGGGSTICSANLTASPASIIYSNQQPVTLYWTSNGANSVVVDGVTYYGSQAASGSTVVYPNSSRTYYMTANCNGTTASSQASVMVSTIIDNYCAIDSFRASPSHITYSGQAVTLYWDTTDTDYVTVEGKRYYTSSDSKIFYPTSDRTYRIVAHCNNGTELNDSERVTVDYTDNYDDLTLTTNRPTNVNTTSATLNGYIDANGNSATRWFRYGTTTGSMNLTTNIVNHGTGAKSVSDSISGLFPNTTYYYQVVASDVQGTHYEANIQSFITNASFIAPSGSTSAVTTVATNISRGGAQLNGLLLNTTNLATSTYFEYGTDVIMNNRTTSKAMGTGTSIQLSDFISGLAPNTVYYFRANAENTNGRVFGSIQVFRTPGAATPVTPTVITRIGAESPIMLKVENRYQCFNNGNTVDYVVTYQNIGSTTLTNPLLQVVLPVHVAFANTSQGTYAPSTHTVSIPLENLDPNKGGVIYVQGQVISLPDNNSEIVTTALLAYTNANGAQENAMAYVLNNQCYENNLGASVLGANALFAGGFWPTTLCGWLLLIIILILIALLIRWLLASRDERMRTKYSRTTTTTTDHS